MRWLCIRQKLLTRSHRLGFGSNGLGLPTGPKRVILLSRALLLAASINTDCSNVWLQTQVSLVVARTCTMRTRRVHVAGHVRFGSVEPEATHLCMSPLVQLYIKHTSCLFHMNVQTVPMGMIGHVYLDPALCVILA